MNYLDDFFAKLSGVPEDRKREIMGSLGLPPSFGVDVSNTTATQNGMIPTPPVQQPYQLPMEAVTNPPNLIPQPEQPWEGSAGHTTMPVEPPTMPVEASLASNKTPVTSEPNQASKTAPSASLLPVDPAEDNRRREAALAAIEHKRRMGLLGAGIAGAGDVIAGGAKAFGVNNRTDAAQGVMAASNQNAEQNKATFELQLRNDPASDISKQYQQLLARFMQKDPADPALSVYSAAQIAERIPAIEKLAAMENQRAMREMQIQANKEARESNQLSREALSRDKQSQQGDDLWTPLGDAKTKNDAKLIKDAYSSYMDTKTGIEELINLRKDKGAEFLNRSAVAKGKTAAANLLLQYKNLAKLGVLSKDDYAILSRLIPDDPLQLDITENTMSKLNQFNSEIDKKISNFATVHGVNQPKEIDTTATTAAPVANTATNELPTVTSEQMYNSLPSGASYKDANGKVYRKK